MFFDIFQIFLYVLRYNFARTLLSLIFKMLFKMCKLEQKMNLRPSIRRVLMILN